MRWQSVYAFENSLKKSLSDRETSFHVGKRHEFNSAKTTHTGIHERQQGLQDVEGGRGARQLLSDAKVFGKAHPPSLRWNTFHGKFTS